MKCIQLENFVCDFVRLICTITLKKRRISMGREWFPSTTCFEQTLPLCTTSFFHVSPQFAQAICVSWHVDNNNLTKCFTIVYSSSMWIWIWMDRMKYSLGDIENKEKIKSSYGIKQISLLAIVLEQRDHYNLLASS